MNDHRFRRVFKWTDRFKTMVLEQTVCGAPVVTFRFENGNPVNMMELRPSQAREVAAALLEWTELYPDDKSDSCTVCGIWPGGPHDASKHKENI